MRPEDTRSLEELRDLVRSGRRPEFLFFAGHRPNNRGRIDSSCLSNWFPAKFTVDGIEYPTTEHYMMAEKALLFGDDVLCEQILDAPSPSIAKSVGRKVSGFDESVWHENRLEIVIEGNLAKFSQNPDLRHFLEDTGSKVLVEASSHDRIWGIGLRESDSHASNPILWRGLNLLGFALMEVRRELVYDTQH